MTGRFATVAADGRPPSIHEEKDDRSPGRSFFPGEAGDAIVTVLEHSETDQHWVRVSREPVPGGPARIVGWMRRAHLGRPADLPTVAPVGPDVFAQACADQELASSAGGDLALAILADYLIALAMIESGLERFAPGPPDMDKVGPYRFGAKAWDAVAAAEGRAPADRLVPLLQIPVAAAVARRDWAEFSTLSGPAGDAAPDGPFLPSFLNLFHAWLVGVPAAHEVDRANRRGDAGALIGPILEKHHPGASNALMDERGAFLRDNGQDARVAGFVRITTKALNGATAEAAKLLVAHSPDFAMPGGGTEAPWMAIAERERRIWDGNGLTESSPAAKERIRAYFAATDHGDSDTAPWCGAFVAFCLRECADEAARNSVVSGAARAANWKGWGDLALNPRTPDGLRPGALVLLSPAANTGSSGHVAFLTGRMAGEDRVFCLGGNQSNRVTETDFPISRIVAVRWLEVAPAAETGAPAEPAVGDQLTMARTLYGEARGEGRKGMEAVAAVIMNRLRSGRFPDSVSGVCLQRLQFSCWNRNDPNRAKILNLAPDADEAIKLASGIARRAISGKLADPTGGAMHFHAATAARPDWVLKSPGARALRIGKHVFYTGIQ